MGRRLVAASVVAAAEGNHALQAQVLHGQQRGGATRCTRSSFPQPPIASTIGKTNKARRKNRHDGACPERKRYVAGCLLGTRAFIRRGCRCALKAFVMLHKRRRVPAVLALVHHCTPQRASCSHPLEFCAPQERQHPRRLVRSCISRMQKAGSCDAHTASKSRAHAAECSRTFPAGILSGSRAARGSCDPAHAAMVLSPARSACCHMIC